MRPKILRQMVSCANEFQRKIVSCRFQSFLLPVSLLLYIGKLRTLSFELNDSYLILLWTPELAFCS